MQVQGGQALAETTTATLGHPTAWGDLGDIDGDGDLELLTCAVHTCGHCPAAVYQQAVIYDISASWELTRVWTSPTSGTGQTDNNDHRCEFGDVNGDGSLDVVTAGKWAYAYSSGTTTRGVRLYLNDGAGSTDSDTDWVVWLLLGLAAIAAVVAVVGVGGSVGSGGAAGVPPGGVEGGTGGAEDGVPLAASVGACAVYSTLPLCSSE